MNYYLTAPLVIWKKNCHKIATQERTLHLSLNPKNLCLGASLDTPPTGGHTALLRSVGLWGPGSLTLRPGPFCLKQGRPGLISVSPLSIHAFTPAFIQLRTGTYCTTMNEINKTSVRDLFQSASSFYCGAVLFMNCFLNRPYS